MRYFGSVYRPPSEAYSLIVQVTYGCSHNTCAFCSMYKETPFALRPMEEILEDFALARQTCSTVRRIFLADGDALIRPAADLERILDEIARLFPECERVTCYASPGSVQKRTPEELSRLRQKNLQMVYMGLESGSDAVLRQMCKGHTAREITAAGQKVRESGIALSVTAISGLGGTALWPEHARETAKALSAMRPDYIGLLTLMVEPGTPLFDWVEQDRFTVPDSALILRETELLLQELDAPGCVFRMNHASNYLSLRGTLNADKPAMLRQLQAALRGRETLRPETWRAL
ncbi:MAG: radical SAM protein [Clostridia bacterium]|nr:radical SAM protein [Clostridia bacterium]